MWMLYIIMWGHIYILTFTWEAWLLLCRVPPLLALHAAHCVAILKHGCIIFSKKNFTDHLSNSGPAVHVLPTFPFLPFELVIRVTNCSLVLEVWLCSRDLIMEVKSDIKLRCLKLWLEKNTVKKLAANWNEPNTDPHADARAESIAPCWCRWQVKNPVHTREEDPLHFGTKDWSTSHAAVQEADVYSTSNLSIISVDLKIKWQQISVAYKDSWA